MKTWKAIALRACFFGIGFAVTIAILASALYWYLQSPKPWDTTAITAQYYRIRTEGEQNTLVFEFILQNNTKRDYSISEYSETSLFAVRAEKGQLYDNLSPFLEYDKVIFLPAGHQIDFDVHLDYSYPESLTENASRNEKKEFYGKVEQYFNEKAGGLQGFVLFDKTSHYEIRMEGGWRKADSEEIKLK